MGINPILPSKIQTFLFPDFKKMRSFGLFVTLFVNKFLKTDTISIILSKESKFGFTKLET
jgi:hypothetical protein